MNYIKAGIYLLEIYLSVSSKIEIGSKGRYEFPVGYYYYVGSAQRNLKARLERHLRSNKKKHWHIDYLLDKGEITRYFCWPLSRECECSLAKYLAALSGGEISIPGFGSSDCSCNAHLIYFPFSLELEQIPSQDRLEKK